MQTIVEDFTSKVLSVGLFLLTVVVVTGNVTDPVNTPKFVVLGALGGALAFAWIASINIQFRKPRVVESLLILFVVWALVASLQSTSPFTQNFYGVYGRNTGFLTYFFFSIICWVSMKFTKVNSVGKLVKTFLIAGLVNIVYSAWVILFGDFLGWNNQYGAILGTFGNPNFVSSFLGICFTLVAAAALHAPKKFIPVFLIILAVIFWELTHANSLQGFVLLFIGLWLLGLYWISTRQILEKIRSIYFCFGLISSMFAILGSFGVGILTSIMRQPTVALRQQYWYSAWIMAKNHPIFGVGMDGYGDWYRRARGAQALITPGPEIVSNAAHNIYLDLLAYGGFPLLFLYILILGIASRRTWTILRNLTQPDWVFCSILLIWFGYHVQSLISINQIGLGAWGWVSTGALLAYPSLDQGNSNQLSNPKRRRGYLNNESNSRIKVEIWAFSGGLLGLLLTLPPLTADMSWASALRTRELTSIQEALNPSYFRPENSNRLANAVKLLEDSKLPDEAIKYARRGVVFNRNNDDAWEMLYFATNSSPKEKITAKAELIRLDPRNPRWENLP